MRRLRARRGLPGLELGVRGHAGGPWAARGLGREGALGAVGTMVRREVLWERGCSVRGEGGRCGGVAREGDT